MMFQTQDPVPHVLGIILYKFLPKFNLTYLLFLETLRSPLEFHMKFSGSGQSLAAQHEFVLIAPPVGQWG